jgi:hypothetical protein
MRIISACHFKKFTRIVTEKFPLLQDCVTTTWQPVGIHVLPQYTNILLSVLQFAFIMTTNELNLNLYFLTIDH